MTPIHVKGKKRKRNQEGVEHEDPASSMSSPCARAKTSNTSHLQASYTESSSIPNLSKGTEQVLNGNPRLSRLEQLPIELLEDIFLKSLNMDLPLVSSSLLSKLSRRTLFHSIFLEIIIKDEYAEDPEAHSDLFCRRFVSMKLFKEMKSHNLLPLKWRVLDGKTVSLSNHWGKFLKNEISNNRTDVRQMSFTCARGTNLPARVFKSSNREYRDLFRQLVFAGANIDWENTATGELATGVLEKAVEGGDYRFLLDLIRADIGLIYDLDLICIATKKYFSTNLREADNGFRCVHAMSHLVDASDEEIRDCDYLWQLCTERRKVEASSRLSDSRPLVSRCDWLLGVLGGYTDLESIPNPHGLSHYPYTARDPYSLY